MLPISNATLTAVNEPGFAADGDQAATAGASKWTGKRRVFWSEVNERVETAGRSDLELRRYLIVEESVPVTWAVGDVVTVTYRAAARTGTVREVQTTTADQLAGVIRLTLEVA